MEQTQAAVYSGDGAAVGKWFSTYGKQTSFHLIARRGMKANRWGYETMHTNAACGVNFFPGFEYSARWAELGGYRCSKCEAKS